jgi:poly(A) polymerase
MIRLYGFLFENKEESVLDYLGRIIGNSPYSGKVFLAGGAVRDEIMGKPVKDIDIVVTVPNGGIEFAEWLTKKVGAYKEGSNPVIYPRFGTAKFNLRGVQYNGIDLSGVDIESVMTRGEKYEKNSRKPEVVYADLKVDAERRDLTVNSLFKDLVTGEIKDLTGKGLIDIKNGIVRTPLDPDITFKDDPLRMLRAIRFAVKYKWKMPLSLVKALKKNAGMLKTISTERIQDELNKILMTDNPDLGLKLLSFTGLNQFIIPELDACRGVTQNKFHKDDVFDHICEVVKNTPVDLIARLGALFHDIGKSKTKTEDYNSNTGRLEVHFYKHEEVGAQMAQEIMTRLKYSNDQISAVSNIVENHMRLKQAGPEGTDISDKALRKFIADVGDNLEPILKVMQADNISHAVKASMPNQIVQLARRMKDLSTVATKPKLPINGNDLMAALGIPPGPILKRLLAAVEEDWYENPNISREEALMRASREYQKLSGSDAPQQDLMQHRIKNPETGNEILVKTALAYEKNHPAYQAAIQFLKSRGSQ